MIWIRRQVAWILAPLLFLVWLAACTPPEAAGPVPTYVPLVAQAPPLVAPTVGLPAEGEAATGSYATESVSVTILHTNDVRGAIYPCG